MNIFQKIKDKSKKIKSYTLGSPPGRGEGWV